MRLTSFTNYALRVLMFSSIKGEELSSVNEISRAYGISRAHLVKCVHLLGKWGYLDSYRGRNGGFRLAMPPEKITVGEIVRHTEDGLELVECFNRDTNTCPIIDACVLSTTFKKGLAAFLEVLDSVTVADLVARPQELSPLLNIQETKSKPEMRANA